MIEHAIRALERGWHVYPLAPGTKVPPKGTDGPKSSTDDLKEVERLWELYPEANIGINTEKSGLVVIDIDVHKDLPNYNPDIGDIDTLFGSDAWSMMITNAGLTTQPKTYEVWTPSGGEHFYFKANQALTIKTATAKLAPGIDVRAKNGTIVGAGSKTKKGSYELHRDVMPKSLPTWLRAALGQAGLAVSGVEQRIKRPTAPVRITDGDKYAIGALKSEVAQLSQVGIGNGQRNDALNTAAFKLRKYVDDGKLDVIEVAEALYETATGPLAMNSNEVKATIKSGLGLK